MNVALKAIASLESPGSHAQEIAAMKSLDCASLARLTAIASLYVRVDAATYDAYVYEYGHLLYELKFARDRFDLWDSLTVLRAIKALRDPSGW